VSAYEGTNSEVFIPNRINGLPVISIADLTFMNNSQIEIVHIPDNINKIGRFENCSKLKEVTFGKNSQLTHIPNRAFFNTTQLKNITIPKTITHIGDYAFYQNLSLETFKIPISLISIGQYTFYNNSKLYNIVLPATIEFIGSSAFYNSGLSYGCIYLEVASVPSTWSTSWTNKSSLQIHWGVSIKDDYIVNLTETNTYRIIGYLGNESKIIIPKQIDDIDVTHIGSYAFAGHLGLIGVTLSINITTVENGAFLNTNNLKYGIIPLSVISIGQSAFSTNSDNTRIYAQAESKGAGWNSSWYMGDADEAIFVYWNTVPEQVGFYEDFQYIKKNNEITITGLLKPLETVIIPSIIDNSAVKSIGKIAFFENELLSEVQLPEGLTIIELGAFAGSSNLKTINIPSTLQIISEYAFDGCTSLTSIYIPLSVIIIGEEAFNYCSKLTIFAQRSEKATGWDSTWNNSNRTVYWNVDKVVEENNFFGIVQNSTVKIYGYTGDLNLVIIPEKLQNYTVTEIATNAIHVNSYAKIVIPNTITMMEQNAIISTSYYNNIYIFSDFVAQPTTWHTSYIYNYSSYIYKYWDGQWSYVNEVPTVN